MTILTAHPAYMTQGEVTYHFEALKYTVNAPIRRLASVSSKRFVLDLLLNRARIVREDWDYSVSIGKFTLAVVNR